MVRGDVGEGGRAERAPARLLRREGLRERRERGTNAAGQAQRDRVVAPDRGRILIKLNHNNVVGHALARREVVGRDSVQTAE
jgi:hypothetical protein